MIAIEMLTACQALEFRRPLTSSETLEKVYSDFRKVVPFIAEDRLMYPEIARSIGFIDNTPPPAIKILLPALSTGP